MSRFEAREIGSYNNWVLIGYYQNDQLVYKEGVLKPPPSKEANQKIIKDQEVKYEPFTNKEKTDIKKRGGGNKKNFTDTQIKKIRKRAANGESIGNLAKYYFVTKGTIHSIVNKKSYRHVE